MISIINGRTGLFGVFVLAMVLAVSKAEAAIHTLAIEPTFTAGQNYRLTQRNSVPPTITSSINPNLLDSRARLRYSEFPIIESNPFGGFTQVGIVYDWEFAAMEFPLSPLPPTAIIQSASLSWKEAIDLTDSVLDQTIAPRVFGYDGNGTVESADFLGGTLLSSTISNNINFDNVTIDVTPFIASLYSASGSHAGFFFRNDYRFASRYEIDLRVSSSGAIPQLTVVYVPELPSPALLMMCFLLLPLAYRKRPLLIVN
jgi:hypothetical protein